MPLENHKSFGQLQVAAAHQFHHTPAAHVARVIALRYLFEVESKWRGPSINQSCSGIHIVSL
jgi:hypothetical protein